MDSQEQSITIIRTFDTPREAVWKAWTTNEGWASWYGQPWENPADKVSLDVKEGGKWQSTTIADGNTINFTGTYREIKEPEKLVFTFDDPTNPDNPDVELVEVWFKDTGDGKCEMTFTQSGNLPPEEYQVGLKNGWNGFFDALEKYLSQN